MKKNKTNTDNLHSLDITQKLQDKKRITIEKVHNSSRRLP